MSLMYTEANIIVDSKATEDTSEKDSILACLKNIQVNVSEIKKLLRLKTGKTGLILQKLSRMGRQMA